MPNRTKFLAFLAALSLLASACGSSATTDGAAADSVVEGSSAEDAETTEDAEDAEDSTAGDVESDEPETSDETTSEDPSSELDPINGGKPVVELTGGDSPVELVSNDLIAGNGNEAAVGDLLEMHYVGVLFDDGSEFDASWDRGQTFTFVLGNGQVIQGWDEGIVGMAVGGRRELTIPAELAYGDASPSAAIPPGSTLVFVVDLIAAHTRPEVDTATDTVTDIDITVITEGDGPEVAAGDTIEVLYSIAEPNGPVVQSSWTDGQTAQFIVGLDQPDIFVGWSEPLVGTNVGDELRIVLPPALGPNPEAETAVVTQVTVVSIVE